MNINLHIERLILDGLDIAPGQRRLLQSALEAELARLLTAGGITAQLASGGALHRIAGNSIQLQQAKGPAEMGRQIAGALYGGIGR